VRARACVRALQAHCVHTSAHAVCPLRAHARAGCASQLRLWTAFYCRGGHLLRPDPHVLLEQRCAALAAERDALRAELAALRSLPAAPAAAPAAPPAAAPPAAAPAAPAAAPPAAPAAAPAAAPLAGPLAAPTAASAATAAPTSAVASATRAPAVAATPPAAPAVPAAAVPATPATPATATPAAPAQPSTTAATETVTEPVPRGEAPAREASASSDAAEGEHLAAEVPP